MRSFSAAALPLINDARSVQQKCEAAPSVRNYWLGDNE
jgi:hypothetical protein